MSSLAALLLHLFGAFVTLLCGTAVHLLAGKPAFLRAINNGIFWIIQLVRIMSLMFRKYRSMNAVFFVCSCYYRIQVLSERTVYYFQISGLT